MHFSTYLAPVSYLVPAVPVAVNNKNKLIGYTDDSTLMAVGHPQALEFLFRSP